MKESNIIAYWTMTELENQGWEFGSANGLYWATHAEYGSIEPTPDATEIIERVWELIPEC